eukprot:5598732-Pyramimonas_sp.AAC.1
MVAELGSHATGAELARHATSPPEKAARQQRWRRSGWSTCGPTCDCSGSTARTRSGETGVS